MRAAGHPQHRALEGCPPPACPAAPHLATCPLPPQKFKPSRRWEVIQGFRSREDFSARGNGRPLKGDGAEMQGGCGEPSATGTGTTHPAPLRTLSAARVLAYPLGQLITKLVCKRFSGGGNACASRNLRNPTAIPKTPPLKQLIVQNTNAVNALMIPPAAPCASRRDVSSPQERSSL